MITKTKTKHSDLAELFGLDKLPKSSDVMKQKLIVMAKSGAKRPHSKTKEGKCLSSYTNKSSGSYCLKFDKTIRKLRPDWFANTAEIMRQKLIAMAKSGAKKPHYKTKEGQRLISYTNKFSGAYCPIFNKLIRKLIPDWFANTVEINKKKLIAMAKSGMKRPTRKTKEGRCLISYTNKSSGAYCLKFDKTIRKLRPDWFANTAEIMRQKLIAMAKSGAKKPHGKKTKEGWCLCNYTIKSSRCYCPIFDKTIRKLRPDWFV